ncbi:MAG: SPOR domain-containing protein [Gammaproteobacteria bacterium]|nr:SPOR domain-containing protein [Gammaproteobacteria bacterium]
MKWYLILVQLLSIVTVPGWAAALAGDQTAAASGAQSAQQITATNDFESEFIPDFELADTPTAPQREFDISAFQDDEYARGRMAFLFGQYEMAYQIWKPLADHGYAKAQATLGWMYHTGKGVTKDLSTAFHWYEKAAEQDHPVAQNNLGVFYEQGLFVGKNASSAAKWYREAAEWGYPFAQYNLGTLYLEGRGVKKDEKEAQFWLQIAALQGVDQAVLALKNMSMSLHGAKPGEANAASISKEPQWTKNDTSTVSGKSLPQHNSPHGSNRYKGIYDRIKSSGQKAPEGFDYGVSSSMNTAKTQPSPLSKELKDNSASGSNNVQSDTQTTVQVDVSDARISTAQISSDQDQKIQQATSEAKPSPPVYDVPAVKPATDELLPGNKFDQWLADAQIAQKRLKELEKEKKTNSHSLKIYNEEWVREQNPANFTLQLARSDKLEWLLDMAKKQPMLNATAYYTAMIDGKKWYFLIYGNFENQKSASAELDKLPKALKQWSPWVRKFSDVQSKIHVNMTQEKQNKQ